MHAVGLVPLYALHISCTEIVNLVDGSCLPLMYSVGAKAILRFGLGKRGVEQCWSMLAARIERLLIQLRLCGTCTPWRPSHRAAGVPGLVAKPSWPFTHSANSN